MQTSLKFRNDSFWFTVEELASIFYVKEENILDKFTVVCDSGELLAPDISAKNKDGILFLNLDAAVSIAYYIDNVKATKFRIEAREKLFEEI